MSKYTQDGKKVVVLGKLNSEEYIVQEIFISEGQEIPGGENFIAKGLLDAPAESWKDKNLREKEQNYERRMKELDREFERKAKILADTTKKSSLAASALFAFASGTEHEAEIGTLKAFLSGEITHVFIDDYKPEIVEWNSDFPFVTESYYGERKVESMRLVSLFGNSAGKLDYTINKWGDGSGSDTRFFPFTSRAAALAKAQEVCDDQAAKFLAGSSCFRLDAWKKIDGIRINPDVENKVREKEKSALAKRISEMEKELADLKAGAA